ncbi:MAG TPA: xanthine dehydrogenase family protein molybdopterin-binding subunit [Acidimicrobiales bacterium]|nr:xanthine dehydrogenase family protein molybdopterin-binding subunit [Acidimicrobiales bacterium]
MTATETEPAAGGSILGTRVKRIEDPALLRGQGTYIDNVAPTDAVHVAFVRSFTAHGRIESIDTSDAEAMPGVLAVFTGADLDVGPLTSSAFLAHQVSQPLLARDVVRFVGEPLAVVVAETKAQAVDAAEAVWADVEPLDAIVDPEAAARDELVVHDDIGTNVVLDQGEPVGPEQIGGDDVVVVSERLVNQRMAAVPLEGRVVAARWDGDRLTQWSCTQGAHGTRDELAHVFGLDPSQVHVITPDVGGGFGAKHGTTPEELVVTWVARRLQRPVRWAETRSENLIGMVQGRGQVQHASLAGTRDGRITGYRLDVIQEGGAYAGSGCVLPYMTRMMAPGCYAVDDVRVRIRSVVTNTSNVGAYRGAGRPEAAAAIERMVDRFAAEIGMDPVEVRRRNLIPPDAFPLRTATGGSYDSGDYEAVLDLALEAAGYEELRAEQARRRAEGGPAQLGIGVSVYVEITNVMRQSEYGSVEITPDGGAVVRTGSSAHGQGHHTAWAMLVSDRTGIPMERIEVRHGDTDDVPRGGGTGGSKSLQIGGAAAAAAAELVVDEARKLAAELLEADPADIVHDPRAGTFSVAGAPVSAKSWAELAAAAPAAGIERLFAETDFEPGGSTFPFGAHVAVVEVDTDTGKVRLLRLVACDDAGTIINPLLVEGQVHGGVAAGASQALFEEIRYDGEGNPLTTTFADYAFPSAAELPSFERIPHETPTPHNPLGAKGIGESGTIGATPAVQNAVVDAVAHLGVRHIDLPLTPERVWTAIQQATG